MKKIILGLIALLLIVPMTVKADDTVDEEKAKVKVYMFEAGGCPACAAMEEYLTKLDSYNKKFELVKKEAYIDHVKWEDGKDYELAVGIATLFEAAGFGDYATSGAHLYQATPFVVVSDVYAQTGYNNNLEEVINKVYDEGDKDVVGCYEEGKDNCLVIPKKKDHNLAVGIFAGVVLVIIAGGIVLARREN